MHSTQQKQELDEHNLCYETPQSRMASLPNYYKWIISKNKNILCGTVLELGVGSGHVLEHYIHRVKRVIGVDINESLLANLKRTFPDDVVQARILDLRGSWSDLAEYSADTVIALDVLEHFEDDSVFVSKMRQILNPGALAIVKVPAQSALYSKMDEASGHYRRYDQERLIELFEANNFSTRSCSYINVAGAIVYRLKSHKRKNFSQSMSSQTLGVGNLLMPLISLLDYLPLKGLSLLAVFEAK